LPTLQSWVNEFQVTLDEGWEKWDLNQLDAKLKEKATVISRSITQRRNFTAHIQQLNLTEKFQKWRNGGKEMIQQEPPIPSQEATTIHNDTKESKKLQNNTLREETQVDQHQAYFPYDESVGDHYDDFKDNLSEHPVSFPNDPVNTAVGTDTCDSRQFLTPQATRHSSIGIDRVLTEEHRIVSVILLFSLRLRSRLIYVGT
jgi:hypothetical protein